MDSQRVALGTELGRQLPGMPQRLVAAKLTNPRRNPPHHRVQSPLTRQPHHVMRPSHNRRRNLSRTRRRYRLDDLLHSAGPNDSRLNSQPRQLCPHPLQQVHRLPHPPPQGRHIHASRLASRQPRRPALNPRGPPLISLCGEPKFLQNWDVRLRTHGPARRTLIGRVILTTPATARSRIHSSDTRIISRRRTESQLTRIVRPRPRPITPRPSRDLQRIQRRRDIQIKRPRHRSFRRLGGRGVLGHRNVRLGIRPRPGTDAQPRPVRAKPVRQLPGKPDRLNTPHPINPRRNQRHDIIQRHTHIAPRQRHHIMRTPHNPHSHLTRPTHRPSPLNLPTKIQLRPLRHD